MKRQPLKCKIPSTISRFSLLKKNLAVPLAPFKIQERGKYPWMIRKIHKRLSMLRNID
jgi:hypothetical protein